MKKKIIVRGPVLSRSGYGEQARFALRALHTRTDLFEIYVLNIPWGATGQITSVSGERPWIEGLCMRTHLYFQENQGVPSQILFDISLQITLPLEFENIAPIDIGYTAGIETTQVPGEWLQKSNDTVDKIITISEHSRGVFTNTKYEMKDERTGEITSNFGLEVPVAVVNYPAINIEPQPVEIDFKTENNFLIVSQWGPRKNLDNTIRWFVEEYQEDESVGLVIKTNMVADSVFDREATTHRLAQLLNSYPDRKCKVYLIHGGLTSHQLTWLYQHPTMKALINIAHGEGYGLPLFEAAWNGLPLVTVTWGGQMDFICKPNKKGKVSPRCARVDYEIKPVQPEAIWPNIIQEGSQWAFPKEKSFKKAVRDILNKEIHYKQLAKGLQSYILEKFTEEKIYKNFVHEVWELVGSPEASEQFRSAGGQLKIGDETYQAAQGLHYFDLQNESDENATSAEENTG